MDISNISARLQTLTNALTILEGQFNDPECDIEDKCIDLFTKLVAVKDDVNSLREILSKMKEELRISAEKIQELEELKKIMSHIRANLPKHVNVTFCESKSSTFAEIKDTQQLHNLVSPIPVSWSHLSSPMDQRAEPVTVKQNRTVAKNVFPKIAYVTDGEFETVPKYMKGRIGAATVNKLIDTFNTVFKKKYETIRQPKKSVKAKDLENYLEWKREENTEPKGTFFVTIKDLNTFGNAKMDKAALNMLTILRHLKRIRETRHANGPQHFISI